MFLSKSKTVIFFENKKFKAIKVSFKAGKPFVEKKAEKDFTSEDLSDKLIQTKKDFGTNVVRILLPEDKTYLKLLEFSPATIITRDLVLKKAQESIPEVLQEGYFDWKQVGTAQAQVLAVSRDYLVPLQQAAQDAKLSLEAFEPSSFALARLTAKEKEVHLIIYKNTKSIICAAYKGQVFGVVTIDDQSKIDKKTTELTKFVKEKWGLAIKKTISGNLDPAIGLALKEDIKGKDEKVLNLTPPKVKKIAQINQPLEKKAIEREPGDILSQSGRISKPIVNKKVALIVSIIILVLALISGGILVYQKMISRKEAVLLSEVAPSTSEDSSDSEAIETDQLEEELLPTVSNALELNREDLSLQVLNGSGVLGEAGRVKEFLEELGYKDVAVGNADSTDYQETEVSIKENKKDYLELLTDDLSEKQTLSSQTALYLDKNSLFDAIIIIGKK